MAGLASWSYVDGMRRLALVVVVLWMGIYPQSFLEPIEVSVAHLVNNYQAALAAAQDATTAVAAVKGQ